MHSVKEIKVYTADEVADMLGVTKRTVYNYLKGGQLKAVKIGKYWRVSHHNLNEFIEKGTEKNPSSVNNH